MNIYLKEKYKIKFENVVYQIEGYPKKIHKYVEAESEVLSDFLNSWNNAQDVKDYLLPDINNVLNNVIESETTESVTVGVDITSKDTFFVDLIDDNSSFVNPDLVLPTEDFKIIVEAWIDFLLTPPLSGTRA